MGRIIRYGWVGISLLHWLLVAVFYKNIFLMPIEQRLDVYVSCRLLSLIILMFFYKFIWKAFVEKNKNFILWVKFSVAYLICLLFMVNYVHILTWPIGDEGGIYQAALELDKMLFFYYFTGYYYISSLMILPFKFGPVLTKVILQALIAGYFMMRIKNKNRYYPFVVMFLFLSPFTLQYTFATDRLHIYYLFYILLFGILYFDFLENISLSRKKILLILVLGSCLTQWRTEGIVLLFFLPLLICATYPRYGWKLKKALQMFLIFLSIQYVLTIPQYGLIPMQLDTQAEGRMAPFYGYIIPNMLREGIDTSYSGDELAKIDKYLDLEVVDKTNQERGDLNYEGPIVLIPDTPYYAVRQSATFEDYDGFVKASKQLIKDNFYCFLKVRWKCFMRAAVQEHVIICNLWITVMIFLILLFNSLKNRNWIHVLISLCVLAQASLVWILAPADYFKYYEPMYFLGLAIAMFNISERVRLSGCL